MSLLRVTSFLQLDCRRNTQSICVKVVENFWDIPATRSHRPITFNVVLADANVYVVGLVTYVYPLTDVVIDGETIYQLTFEIMDESKLIRLIRKMKNTLFSAINDSKETWSVHAKVLRKWVVRRKTSPFAVWKIDVIGFLQAFGRLQDQRRESDVIKKLNFYMADQHENSINVTLWGDCAEETYGKKTEDMEPPIIILVRFARLSQDSVGTQLFSQISNIEHPTYTTESLLHFRTRILLGDVLKLDEECDVITKVTIQKVETLYGWSYDACPCDKKPEYQSNGSLRCSKCNKEVLMTVPKFKVHYKVYDNTGKCSIIFFDRQATELLGKSASKIKEDMQKEGKNSTVPEELDEIAGKVLIVKLRIKSHNIKHRTSSIGVTQLCVDNHLIQQFQYTNQQDPPPQVEESSTSKESVRSESVINVIEDDDKTMSQMCTPVDSNSKRKIVTGEIESVCVDIGLSEIATPTFSTTKPMKNIKNEK
ncbi:hypothetical protein K1719_015210 [Acacia pycnantha]|nr:hypothetical protein K1719_015210 [Acacia pycnantha]